MFYTRQSCFAPKVMFYTRQSRFAPDSHVLHRTVTFSTLLRHSWNQTVTVGTRQSHFALNRLSIAPDSHVLHQTGMFCTRQSQLAPYSHGCYQTVTFCTRQSRLATVSHGWHQTIAAQTADSICSCNYYTIQSLHFISAAVIQLWLLLYKLR